MKSNLIVTIDTEEEGLWSGSFLAEGNTVENAKAIPDFQALCDNHGIKPVYLIDTPILSDEHAVRLLRGIADQARCEIGTHIHPWNTPPVQHNITPSESYLCNLTEETQLQKIRHVSNDIENKFGSRPTSFRAGRYGLDSAGAKLLADEGYEVDSSVCPFMDYSADGGPDFNDYPTKPYFVGADLKIPSKEKTALLEVPVTFGFNRSNFALSKLAYDFSGHRLVRPFRLRGILDRLSVLKKLKLSPEKHNSSDLCRLVEMNIKNGNPASVMMFHSSSLLPGNTPYVKSKTDLDNFFKTLDETFDYCLKQLNMRSLSLTEFAREFHS